MTLDPEVRELLAAVRATMYAPYATGHSAGSAIAQTRGVLAAVLFDGVELEQAASALTDVNDDIAEESDAGRVRFADRRMLSEGRGR